jgi:hypothetical protein
MTQAERIEALEAQVAKLTAAALLADPVAGAVMLSGEAVEPEAEADADEAESTEA